MRTTFCEKAFPLLEVTTILFKNCDLNLTQFKREEGVENLCHSRAERVSLCLLQEVSVTCIIIDFVNFILTFFIYIYRSRAICPPKICPPPKAHHQKPTTKSPPNPKAHSQKLTKSKTPRPKAHCQKPTT